MNLLTSTGTTHTAAVVAVDRPTFDRASRRSLRRGMREALRQSPNVVLDLSGLTHIDTAGVSAIVDGLRDAIARGGDVKASGASRAVQAFFKLVRVNQVLDILPTVQQAIDAFGATANSYQPERSGVRADRAMLSAA